MKNYLAAIGCVVVCVVCFCLLPSCCAHGQQISDVTVNVTQQQEQQAESAPVVILHSRRDVYVSRETERKLARHPSRYEGVIVARSRASAGYGSAGASANYGSAGSVLRSSGSTGTSYELRAVRVARSSGSTGSAYMRSRERSYGSAGSARAYGSAGSVNMGTEF